MDLTKIKGPSFLKELTEKELNDLAKDIRQFIIESVSQTGGHLSSNLGIVELTIALHYVFNSPEDKIFFDVGHQCYVHKILTGRAKDFTHLRKFNGLSGFQKPLIYYIDNIYHLENFRNKFYKNTCISHLVCYNIVNNDYSLSIRIKNIVV